MHRPLFRRGISLMLTFATLLSLGLTAHAAEADSLCAKHPQHTADCGFEATGVCSHTHSVEAGCLFHKCSHTHDGTCYDTSGNENCPHDCETTPACYTLLIALKGTDVVLPNGTEYTYTGEEIRPAVIVTVNKEVLKEQEHYTLTYANNTEPGTATVVVTGIATAGYEGAIVMPFTIVKAEEPTEPETPTEPEKPTEPETPTEPKPTEPEETKPEETKPEETKPEETKPEETKPEETKPEETTPEETQPVEYKFTKGSGSKWHQKSGKNLSFTVNADTKDITAIRVDGKKLDKTHYTLGKDGVITLKSSYLEKLAIGTYPIAAEFEDGKAVGKFTVSRELDPSNPATGDSILVWVALLGLSAAGAVTLIFLKKRKV